ncbi:short-chain dehydrogenase [Spirochaetia bacterium]|nr:short-chain dehydrogenase [Spirochaetia bacterium]
MSLENLVEVSRYYGKNPDYVLAGGGNTSWKDGDLLYVKASGMALADVESASFVKMDRKALAKIWGKNYPAEAAERESAVLADMMAARLPGEDQKRPSVEALLHDIMPFTFVVHLHPAKINGLTCSRMGEAAMKNIFGDEAIWIPSTNPGYILSKTVKTAMDDYYTRMNKNVAIIFLQNHGVFVGADTVEHIKELYSGIMSNIALHIQREPCFSDEKRESNELSKLFAELGGEMAIFAYGGEVAALVKDCSSFKPVSSVFTPDHIVYAGSDPLFVEETDIRQGWENHVRKTGRDPKIAAVRGRGICGIGITEKAATLALDLFRDSIKVAVYSEPFGGPCFMTADKIDFINNWEVERFRSNVSGK